MSDISQVQEAMRPLVLALWELGYTTTDSGDGVTNVAAGMECALDFPHVVVLLPPDGNDIEAEARALHTRLAHRTNKGPDEFWVEANYSTLDRVRLLTVIGLTGADITTAGTDSPSEEPVTPVDLLAFFRTGATFYRVEQNTQRPKSLTAVVPISVLPDDECTVEVLAMCAELERLQTELIAANRRISQRQTETAAHEAETANQRWPELLAYFRLPGATFDRTPASERTGDTGSIDCTAEVLALCAEVERIDVVRQHERMRGDSAYKRIAELERQLSDEQDEVQLKRAAMYGQSQRIAQLESLLQSLRNRDA